MTLLTTENAHGTVVSPKGDKRNSSKKSFDSNRQFWNSVLSRGRKPLLGKSKKDSKVALRQPNPIEPPEGSKDIRDNVSTDLSELPKSSFNVLPSLYSLRSVPTPREKNSKKPCPIVTEADELLSKCQSDPEAKRLLSGMIFDLLQEVNTLNAYLEKIEGQVQSLRHTDESTLNTILRALQEGSNHSDKSVSSTEPISISSFQCSRSSSTNEQSKIREKKQKHNPQDEYTSSTEDMDMSEVTLDEEALGASVVLSPQQATDMVVRKLMENIQKLNMDKIDEQGYLEEMQEQIDDLESEKEAAQLKLEILEWQFGTIAKKRLDAISRYRSRKVDAIQQSLPKGTAARTARIESA